jgi:prevent-host-death family protein
MVNLSEDIHPLTEFKRNTTGMVKQMKKTKRPVVLTVNGKAELVVQDANSYQKMLERLDRLEAVEAIRQGLQDVEQGRVRDARSALEGLRKKLGL